MTQYNSDSLKVNLITKNNANNSNNMENINDISNNNIEDEKYKISPLSPIYIFCDSLKEINTQNETGWTPIYRSVLANNIPALTELLKLGGNPNICNNLGETPLYLSVENQNYEALTKLLEYKADTNIKKRNGNTPLHIALKKKLENKYILILLKNKADPNISNKLYSQTPTHLALINKSDEEILKCLKENKADIYGIKDKYDKTPFDYVKDSNDNEYLNKVISIFGKKEKTHNDTNIQIKENDRNNGDIIMGTNPINAIKIHDENNININKTNKNMYEINEISFNYFKLNQQKPKNENILFDKINKYELKDDHITIKLNINNIKEKIDEESNKENKNININNNPITLDILDTNYLLNSLNKAGNITKKNNKTELKNKISLPEYLKVENKNDINVEKIGLTNNYINNDFNSIVSRNKNNSNDNNLFVSNVNSSLCYSLSKETQTQKKKESESEIEIKNKILSNSLETDKEAIKTIISSTTKKGNGPRNENNNNLSNDNNKNSNSNNLNQINKIIYNNKNAENSKVFTPKNISNDIVNIIDAENENKTKEIERKIEIKGKNSPLDINIKLKEENQNWINNNISNQIKNSKFEIEEDHIKNVNNLKININEINNDNDDVVENVNKIYNKENDNLISLTNNSNIFSELQMNSTDGNYNKTKEDQKEDNLIIKESEIVISKNNTSNGNISNIIKKNSIQNKGTFSDEKNIDINFSISNYNENVINPLKTKEIESLKKDFQIYEEQNQNEKNDENENKSDINVNISYLNNKIIESNSAKKNEIISQKENSTNKNCNNQVNSSHRQISYHNSYNNKKNKNELDKDNSMNINNEDEIAELTNKTNRTNKTYKIINIISEKKNNSKKCIKYNKGNENRNNLMIYHNKNYLARTSNKNKLIKNTNPNCTINLRHKIYYGESRSTDKKDNKILYNKQLIYRHSSPDYNYNYQRHFNKDNLITENSYKNNNNSFLSILNTNRTNESNNNIFLYDNANNNTVGNRINYNNNIYSNQYPLYNPYDDSIEGSNTNNTNIIVYRNKNKLSKNNFIYNPNSFNNTTFSSYHNNICKIKNKNYLEPLINRNSVSNNSFSNNSNSNCNSYRNNSGSSSYRNSNNQNILISDNNNNVYLTKNNCNFNHILSLKHQKAISNNILIRLRDWLISCDLLCYYNILISNNMYNIDSFINDIRNNKIVLSFKDIEELGIKKPGHIFRLLLKLEVDSGKIDNNIYNYIIEKFNINTVTNNGVLTSSISDIKCCGLNCCSTNNKHNGNNRRIINNNNIYSENYNFNNYGDIKTNTNETENDYCEEINYSDIFSFLKRKNLWRFKENFIHNGFDQIEYILIQLFSNYSFNKSILNDYMHIYLDEEKNYVLKKLYYEKKKICNILGIQYNKEELRQILLSQSSSGENYYNNYMSSAAGTHSNNHNNNSCCIIY